MEDNTRIIKVLGFGGSYIRDFTVRTYNLYKTTYETKECVTQILSKRLRAIFAQYNSG